MSARVAVLDDPQLVPFLPLLWVAWADGDLAADERLLLQERIAAAPWLRPAARGTLARWLDARNPPSGKALEDLRVTLAEVALTLSPNERRDLVALARVLVARANVGSLMDQKTAELLRELSMSLGAEETTKLLSAKPPAPDAHTPIASSTIDVPTLRRILDGEHVAVRDNVRSFLNQPELRAYGLPTAEYRAWVATWLHELARRGFGQAAFPGQTTDATDMGSFVAIFETLAMGDLSLLVRFGVQFGLFGGSIYSLGTGAQKREWLPAIASLATPGCFAMSETGHGSDVSNLETEAVWNPATRTFVVHTPRESARKDWIGGAAQHARVATVFAQLHAHGTVQGVHAFVVPIRNADGTPCTGVRIGDSGQKMGLNGVDNGRLWFDHVAIPESALLARFAHMDAEGNYQSSIPHPSRRFFTMLGTLVGGRVSVACAAVTVSKVALSIAVRYAEARRSFGANRQGPRLLDYPSHQARLLPRLATSYVYHFAAQVVRERFAELQEPNDTASTVPPDTRTLEAYAAAFKVLASTHAVQTVREVRQACGGQGYLAVNRIPDLCADVEIFTTFEGDNTVLLQLVAKSLLSGFAHRFESGGFGAVVRHLAEKAKTAVTEKNPVAVRLASSEHLRSRAFHLSALAYREAQLLESAAARIRHRLGEKMDAEVAFMEVQSHVLALAQAHCDRLALEFFDQSVQKIKDTSVRVALDRLGALHAVQILRSDPFFLASGYLENEKASALRKEYDSLLREIRVDAVALVEAFGIPPTCLAAPIAFMDPAHPDFGVSES